MKESQPPFSAIARGFVSSVPIHMQADITGNIQNDMIHILTPSIDSSSPPETFSEMTTKWYLLAGRLLAERQLEKCSNIQPAA
jgi:hypothetical protein